MASSVDLLWPWAKSIGAIGSVSSTRVHDVMAVQYTVLFKKALYQTWFHLRLNVLTAQIF